MYSVIYTLSYKLASDWINNVLNDKIKFIIWGKISKRIPMKEFVDCEVNISYYIQRKYVSKYVHNNKQISMWISGLWRMIELSFLNKKYDHLNR